MSINPFQDMRAVILLFFVLNDYLSHAQVNKIKKNQWALAGLPNANSCACVIVHAN